MTHIAFIGLGHMGGPMAANLVKAGHTVTGFDLAPAALDDARAHGVGIAASGPEAATDADVVITMLLAGQQVLDVYQGGLLAAAKPGTLFIDSSTIDVDSARAAHELAVAAGHRGMDAPVSASA